MYSSKSIPKIKKKLSDDGLSSDKTSNSGYKKLPKYYNKSANSSIAIEKFPILRGNTQIIKKVAENLKKPVNVDLNLHTFTKKSIDLSKFFESMLVERLSKCNSDENTELKIYLEIFEKIISIDTFGPILEKVKNKFIEYFNKSLNYSITDNDQERKVIDEENKRLKKRISENQKTIKDLETKLKVLSNENIDLFNNIQIIQEENLMWREFKKKIKLNEGTPDFTPVIKELRTKTVISDSLSKKVKELQYKEKKYMNIIKLLKEKGVNVNEIITNARDRSNSVDSINISKLDISEISVHQ